MKASATVGRISQPLIADSVTDNLPAVWISALGDSWAWRVSRPLDGWHFV